MNLDLQRLNLEEKKRLLLLALEKKQIRASNKLSTYVPHSGAWRGKPDDGQAAFHRSPARVRILCGGNQVGKTLAGCIEAVQMALGLHPIHKIKVPNKGRIIASLGFEEGVGQIIAPKLHEWIPDMSLKKPPERNAAGVETRWEFRNGSVINILSGEQEPKVFEGWTGDWAWIDEPCSQVAFTATRRGLLKADGRLWMTLTPLSEPWIYNDLWLPAQSGERTDVGCFTMDIWDNYVGNGGYLSKEAIEAFESDLTDDVKEARLHGKFRHLSGRIYPMFDPAVHVVKAFKVPAYWQVYEGIDTHLSKPHAYCQWAVNPDEQTVYVCNEIYEKYTIRQLGEAILQKRRGLNVVDTIIDWAANTPDSVSRRSPRDVLTEMGIRTSLAKKHENVIPGIEAMRDILTLRKMNDGTMRPKFYVMDHCKRHIKEFLNYVQDDRNTAYLVKDTPRKTFDDMMDLDRYFILQNNMFISPEDTRPYRLTNFRYTHRRDLNVARN